MVNRLEEQRVWAGLAPKLKRGILAVKENMTVVDGKAFSDSGKDISHMVEVVVKTSGPQVRGLKVIDELTALEKENGGFVWAFFKQTRTIVERFPSLTQQDVARLMFIGTYVAWKTGRLQSDNGKKIIDREALEKLVDMSRKRFNELFRRYEAEGILREDTETGEIFMNPTVFYRGPMKDIGYDVSDMQYTRMFKTTVRNLYAEFKGRRLGQLAIIYSVIPFLNFNTNIICFNPEETATKLLRAMNLGNLAALLGYKDAPTLKRALATVKIDDKPVFWCPKSALDNREYRVIVNPDAIYGGDGESLAAIQTLFR